MNYAPRVVDIDLDDRLKRAGAVLVEGPRACGKTATSRQVATSEIRLDVDPQVEAAMTVDPSLLLEGDTPRLLDEWQEQPKIWNHVRRQVDARSRPGQFILTGSSVPRDDARRHTGAGRISRMRMRTMSLWETGDSTGVVSLRHILEGGTSRAPQSPMTVHQIAELVVRGGWPMSMTLPLEDARKYATDYLDLLVDADLSRVAGSRRDPVKIRRLLRSLARNMASEVSVATLTGDVAGSDLTTTRETTMGHLDALERLMITEDQPAWTASLRSSARLRKAPKRHLADPSLAAAALDATPESLVADLNTLGFLFESLAVRDLRVYAQANNGRVSHFRDSNGREVDAIIELADGGWAAIEIKLGTGAVDAAAVSLLRFAGDLDLETMGKPRALIVLTGLGLAYQRPDGVHVVPIGTLKP